MNRDNDAIRQANQKALPKFFAGLAASLIVGVALGLALAFLNAENFGEALAVCVVWGAGQSVYSYWAMKLARSGSVL